MANTVIGSQQESLGIGDGGMHPGQVFGSLLGRNRIAVVSIAHLGQPGKRFKAIGSDLLSGSDVLFNEHFNLLLFHRFNGLHGDKSGMFAFGFHHHQHGCFVRRSPAPAAFSGAPEKSVVHFNKPGERITAVPLGHGLANFMKHQPGGFIPKFKLLGQAHGGNSTFVLAGQVNGPKPLEERGAGFMKNGSRREGYLKVAFRTLQQMPGGDSESLVMHALRAYEALGPAHFFKRLLTGPLGGETFFEFKQGQFGLDHGKPPCLR